MVKENGAPERTTAPVEPPKETLAEKAVRLEEEVTRLAQDNARLRHEIAEHEARTLGLRASYDQDLALLRSTLAVYKKRDADALKPTQVDGRKGEG